MSVFEYHGPTVFMLALVTGLFYCTALPLGQKSFVKNNRVSWPLTVCGLSSGDLVQHPTTPPGTGVSAGVLAVSSGAARLDGHVLSIGA